MCRLVLLLRKRWRRDCITSASDIKTGLRSGIGHCKILHASSNNSPSLSSDTSCRLMMVLMMMMMMMGHMGSRTGCRRCWWCRWWCKHSRANSFKPLTLISSTLLPFSCSCDSSSTMDGTKATASIGTVMQFCTCFTGCIRQCTTRRICPSGIRSCSCSPFVLCANLLSTSRGAETARAVATRMCS